MSESIQFVGATPVLASLSIERSVDFFVSRLGFTRDYAVEGEYGIVSSGAISIHFWACADASLPKATSCRVEVRGIEQLYLRCQSCGIVHPNAPLEPKPWGSHEFGILDPDGNLVTFHERSRG